MFTPEYLNELVESTHVAATEYNMYLTNKVIDSIVNLFEHNGKIEIVPTNQHRIKLLKESGILVSDIEKEIVKRLPGLDKKIKEAFYQAGYDINEDINKSVSDMVAADKELKDFVGKAPRLDNLTEDEKKILDAAYKRTNGEIRNLTKTTAADINQHFMKSCDSAWWKAKHGVDPSTAIREAIDEVSRYGANITYSSGRKMSVEAAVRMCVLTGLNQANAEITLSVCADAGIKYVLVSSHIGARYTNKIEPANHESWQGKVYSLSDKLLKKFGYEEKEEKQNIFGKIKEFFQKFRRKESYEDFETVTGYGTIEGLCGINCRHTFEPFYPGMKNNQTPYDSEENKKAYDLSQQKRAMERKIRDTKKRLFEVRHVIKSANDENLIAGLKEDEAKIKALFDKQNSEYTAFCRQNGLRRSEDRLYVSKADGATTRYEHMDSSVREYRILTEDGTIAEGKDVVNVLEVMTELPQKAKNALSNAVFRTNSSKGNGYNPQTGEIFLAKGASRRQVLHEIGHHLENNIMNERKLNELKRKAVQNLTKDDIMCNVIDGQKIFTLKNGNFINRYQTRLYVDTLEDALNQDGTIKTERLGEFASVLVEYYFCNPKKLKANYADMYEYIEEALH